MSQFYTVLHTNPQFLYRFYTDDSTLTHADGEDGSAITVKSQKVPLSRYSFFSSCECSS